MMTIDNLFLQLRSEFNNRLKLKERKPGIFQLIAPLYHEDGDMVEIFINEKQDGQLRVSDFGKTLMRLSYSYELDTANKKKIFGKILSANGVGDDDGSLYIDTNAESLYSSILQLSSVIFKVSNMEMYKREVIKNLFFEQLDDFVVSELNMYQPQPDYLPLEGKIEYRVNYCFNGRPRPIYLFGVSDSSHARLTTISCLVFRQEKIPFRSVVVIKSLEDLAVLDSRRLLTVVDKIFPSYEDFESAAVEYFSREYQET